MSEEIPGAELLALRQTGHEYFPPGTCDLMVHAILRHSSGRGRSQVAEIAVSGGPVGSDYPRYMRTDI